jgi:transmembrane sensor
MDRGPGAVSEREAAAMWHDRLHRDQVSEETRQAFNDWLAESPRRRELYRAQSEVWAKLQASAEDPRILALRHQTSLRLTRRTYAWIRPLRWVAVVAILVIGGLLATSSLYPAANPPFLADILSTLRFGTRGVYHTDTGERLAFQLADGSQVMLDTQSELQVSFSPAERLVRLTRGQAFFEVSKDAHRPFVVDTGRRRLVAVGTAFDVRLDGDQVKVTMLEGTVRVERTGKESAPLGAPGKANPSGTTLSKVAGDAPAISAAQPIAVATIVAGEQLVADAQREDRVQTTDPERDTSWRRGQVIFENTRLAEAVAELNRYSEAKIQLADPELADIRLSGAFATGRPTVFVEAITAYYPIVVARSDDRAVVLRKKT